MGVCVLVLGLLCSAAAVDAFYGQRAWRLVGVSTPASVKLLRGVSAEMTLTMRNSGEGSLMIRAAPDFPAAIQSADKVVELAGLLAGNETVCLLKVCAGERGDFQIDGCFLEVLSPWKLWLARGRTALKTTIRVQPNLAANKVAAVFLRHLSSGLKAYRQLGEGREFEKLREYSPGDTFDRIYWKATAKRAHPVTKVFQIERSQQCYVMIDCSRQSAENNALDYYVEAALVMGLAAQQFQDQFGVLTFSDRVHAFQPARPGKAQFGRCRDAIYALQPRRVSADFTELAVFAQLHVRRRALIFLLTSLADPYATESLAAQMRLLTARHIVVVGTLQQPGVRRIFEGAKPENESQIYAALAGHISWKKLREFGNGIQTQGAELALCTPENIYADLANRYSKIRQRQRL
jgi:uncharacterized protein (DUF58 family)